MLFTTPTKETLPNAAAALPPSKTRRAIRWHNGAPDAVDDCLIVEEPLEIRVNGRRFTTTMRTPGQDELLARGLLFTEGVIHDLEDIEQIICTTTCRDRNEQLINIANVILHESGPVPVHLWERSLISNSSCGLCGKASVEALRTRVLPLRDGAPIDVETLLRLPHILREGQTLFHQTGGLHAAGIFDGEGRCRALFEDIGRHNATDKAIGLGLEEGWLPWHENGEPLVLLVSGRASFEIVQKALMARIPIVCSVSAASTLAVELAEAHNQTLVAFLREASLTVYCGEGRVQSS